MTRVLAFVYGLVVYLFFLATFCYAIGFVSGLPLPKTVDTGPVISPWAAAVINLLLLSLFALQHSIMARRGFKRWWTRIVPPVVERSTFVLFASAVLALLLW